MMSPDIPQPDDDGNVYQLWQSLLIHREVQ